MTPHDQEKKQKKKKQPNELEEVISNQSNISEEEISHKSRKEWIKEKHFSKAHGTKLCYCSNFTPTLMHTVNYINFDE